MVDNTYTNVDYYPTSGVVLNIKIYHQYAVSVRVQMWDTAGQERFYSITKSYFRGAQVAFICIDISSDNYD